MGYLVYRSIVGHCDSHYYHNYVSTTAATVYISVYICVYRKITRAYEILEWWCGSNSGNKGNGFIVINCIHRTLAAGCV